MAGATIKEIRSWITPVLVTIIGFLAKNKLEEIEDAVKLIPGVQQQITVNATNIEAYNRELNDLKGQFLQHVDLAAKSEEEITLEKLKKSFK